MIFQTHAATLRTDPGTRHAVPARRTALGRAHRVGPRGRRRIGASCRSALSAWRLRWLAALSGNRCKAASRPMSSKLTSSARCRPSDPPANHTIRLMRSSLGISLASSPTCVRCPAILLWFRKIGWKLMTTPPTTAPSSSTSSRRPTIHFKAVGERTVSVQVTSVVRASDSSFQVKWVEQIYEHDALAKTERWTAIVSVITQQPNTAEVLRKNPLGLYVNGLNWFA